MATFAEVSAPASGEAVAAEAAAMPAGLHNQGATDYLNAVLQMCFLLPELRRGIYCWQPPADGGGEDGDESMSIPRQLQKLFVAMETAPPGTPVRTADLTHSFGWGGAEAATAQDAQEYLRVFLDSLEAALQGSAQENLIRNVFGFNVSRTIECQCPGGPHTRARDELYLDLSLETANLGSLEECLESFLRPELLTGDNQFLCEAADPPHRVDAHMGDRLAGPLPPVLVVNLRRFSFDFMTMQSVKLNHPIRFPFVLNMNRFRSRQFGDNTGQAEAVPDAEAEGYAIDTNAQALIARDGEWVYTLCGAICHVGSATSGHYTVRAKSHAHNAWFNFDDAHVRKLSPDDVREAFGGDHTTSNAYMLFYHKVEEDRDDADANAAAALDLPEDIRAQLGLPLAEPVADGEGQNEEVGGDDDGPAPEDSEFL